MLVESMAIGGLIGSQLAMVLYIYWLRQEAVRLHTINQRQKEYQEHLVDRHNKLAKRAEASMKFLSQNVDLALIDPNKEIRNQAAKIHMESSNGIEISK